MTVGEIISKTDDRKPNHYTDGDKMDWLSDLDGRVLHEVLERYEGDTPAFSRYTSEEDILLADDTYCDMYIYYLMAQMDFFNAEYTRYNNSSAAFNQAFTDFARQYHRTHVPRGTGWKLGVSS